MKFGHPSPPPNSVKKTLKKKDYLGRNAFQKERGGQLELGAP